MTARFEEVTFGSKTYMRVPPDASRMVRGMGRLAYAFNEAIADLVDNSIGANASEIEIVIEQRVGGRVYVHILDNGHGIASNALADAIQYGAAANNDDANLNVYGFGLKTACQSFTDTFMVASVGTGASTPTMITFDEKLIYESNDFLFAISDAPIKYQELISRISSVGTGTLVVTENAERLFDAQQNKITEPQVKRIVKRKVEQTHRHLRKTFQRFLDRDDARARNVRIRLNGVEVKPWDPFCLAEGIEPLETLSLNGLETVTGKSGSVRVDGYVLPAKDDFKDEALADDSEIGPNTHGVYVYREHRLIMMATYFDLFKRETHHARLRVNFSYDGELDELFHTGLQKGDMVLGDLEEKIRDFLIPLRREANRTSRINSLKKDTKSLHDASQRQINKATGTINIADIVPIDEHKVTVHAKFGDIVLPISSYEGAADALPINPVDSINDGLLWQLRLQNGRQVVELNKGHDFYRKVYLANKQNSIAVQGLDMLIYALAIAETQFPIPTYERQYREFQYEVSRTLRQMTDSLADPELDQDDDE